MIFCDMDGVLVDFDEGYKQKFGVYPRTVERPKLWEIIINTPNYWLDLQPHKDAHILITFLEKHGFEILTGLPHYGYDKAEIEKRAWIKKYIGEHIKVNCCLSKDKQKYIKDRDILIDDWEPNIKRWTEAGGIGILHTSAEDTIQQLKKYGYE